MEERAGGEGGEVMTEIEAAEAIFHQVLDQALTDTGNASITACLDIVSKLKANYAAQPSSYYWQGAIDAAGQIEGYLKELRDKSSGVMKSSSRNWEKEEDAWG